MNTNSLLVELATGEKEMHAGLWMSCPNSITNWNKLIQRTAIDLLACGYFDLDMNDMSKLFDELVDPDHNYPYFNEKWEAINYYSAWASNDLVDLAEETMEVLALSKPHVGKLFIAIDSYLYALHFSACLAILAYLQDMAVSA